LTYKIRVVCL